MLEISPQLFLDEAELQFHFVRASGPGGQNVNTTSSAVQLRFDVADSPSLPDDVRKRLASIAGNRMTMGGILIIEARRFRTQEQNRQDAVDRLVKLIRRAFEKPKARKPSRPGVAAKRRRLEAKRQRGQIKRLRAPVGWEG